MNPPAIPNIFVISLESARVRRDYMRAQLDSPHIPNWRFVDAIPKAELDAPWVARREQGRRYASGPLTISEHACLASHLKAWRAIEENGDPLAIVLEDDATLSEDFPETIDALSRRVGAEDELVAVLNWVPLYYALGATRLRKRSRLNRVYVGHGAQGYLVTRASVRRLQKIHDEILINPDDWTYFIDHYGFDVRCVRPYCVAHGLIGRNSQLAHRHAPSPRRSLQERLKNWLSYKFKERYLRRNLLMVRSQPRVF